MLTFWVRHLTETRFSIPRLICCLLSVYAFNLRRSDVEHRQSSSRRHFGPHHIAAIQDLSSAYRGISRETIPHCLASGDGETGGFGNGPWLLVSDTSSNNIEGTTQETTGTS